MKRNVVVVAAIAVVAGVVALVVLRGKHETKPGQKAAKPTRASTHPASSVDPSSLQVRFDDDPTGSLRLEGQVLGADGEPVAGAAVTVSSNPARTTRSEGDGSFAFDGLLPRPYRVTAHAGELFAGPVTVRLTATSDPVVLRLQRGASLEVSVIDADGGAPIKGAEVTMEHPLERSASTDASGVARLAGLGPGWYVLRASAPGYGSVMRMARLAGTAGAIEKQTIRLRRGQPVSGVVLGPSGAPVAGAEVVAESASSSFFGAGSDETKSDDKGRWKIAALAPGTYRFSARHAEHAPGTSGLVTIDASSGRNDVEIRLGVGGRISGRVVDGGGRPVPSASVRVAGGTPASIRSARVRQAQCDKDGRFEIAGLPRAKVKLAAFAEEATSSAHEVDLAKRAAAIDLEIVLDRTGMISGIVVDGSGEPIAEARVEAMSVDFMSDSADWSLRGRVTAIADQEGKFVLRGIGKGKLHISARRPGGPAPTPMWFGTSRAAVIAQAGDRDVKVVLEKGGSIVGRVVFEDGKVPELFAVSAGLTVPIPFSGTGGKFRLDRVSPGKHVLRITGPGILASNKKGVEVASGAEVDVGTIEVHKGRSVRGRVLDSAGAPIEGATVSAGVFLMGDGTRFSNESMGAGLDDTTATSGADGRYVLYGVGERELVIVADHPTAGRSAVVEVPKGKDDPTIDLRLAGTGALEGKVTRGGKPVAAMVTAKPDGIERAQLTVQTGPDGSFRFDRLAPGTYGLRARRMDTLMIVTASTAGPEHMAKADVKTGNTARVNIAIPEGPTVQIAVKGVGGDPAPNASISLLRGKVNLSVGKDPREVRGARQSMAMEAPGVRIPAAFDNVEPGDYTICGIPLPSFEALTGSGGSVSLSIKGDEIPPVCKPVTVKPAPEKQTFDLALPPYPQKK